MRRIFTIILFILVFIVGAVFTSANTVPATLNYYFGSLTLPLSSLLLITLAIGVLIGALAVYLATLGLRYENRRLKKKNKLAEQEIDTLRVLPLKDIP